ncbi:uncharacterized protein LOC132552377 [Ylistrum balloti]|uniref:uncharacterized protein LOC132552377 n=1 Tax=Ylistrum balloti TaxID=509963 RepID=UPI002905DFD3|nr:uncharacterized protein LOC132552377 [Ylistrum balloti]
MVNMKLILLVSLVIVFTEAAPPIKKDHKLVKRSLFDTASEFVRNSMNSVQESFLAAKVHIENAGEAMRESHENVREQLDQLGDRMRMHLDSARERIQQLGADLNLGDDNEGDTEPVDLS